LKTEKKDTTGLSAEDISYRQLLVTLEHSSQEKYDQAIMTLSGGALGITFAFVKDVASPANDVSCFWLLAAWFSWGVSVTAVLFSFFFSQCALRTAINQVDNRTHRKQRLGGSWNVITAVLNVLGGVAFLLGVICFSVFTAQAMRDKKEVAPTASSTASAVQQQLPMQFDYHIPQTLTHQ